MRLPTAFNFLPSANCVPSGMTAKGHQSFIVTQYPVGNCHLVLPTDQLFQTNYQQRFRAVGKMADFLLPLRGKADACHHPSGKASSLSQKFMSQKTKGRHHG